MFREAVTKNFIILLHYRSIHKLSLEHMTQESNSKDKTTASTTVSKLSIDRPSDFRFHAAYLIYSEAWNKAASDEVRGKLNELMEALSKETIDYESFYTGIHQFRVEFNPDHYVGSPYSSRTRIETARKRDWRKREERERRNERHGR